MDSLLNAQSVADAQGSLLLSMAVEIDGRRVKRLSKWLLLDVDSEEIVLVVSGIMRGRLGDGVGGGLGQGGIRLGLD